MEWHENRIYAFFDSLFEGFAYCQTITDEQELVSDVLFLHVNPAFKRLTGLDDIVAKSIKQFSPNLRQINPGLVAAVERVVATGMPEQVESFLPLFQRWVSIAIYRPEPGYLIVLLEDVTERKRTEDELRTNQELFSLFMRHSPIYAFIKESTPTESRVIQASENYCEMIGIAGCDMIGKTMYDLFPPAHAAQFTADDWAVVSQNQVLKLDEELNGRHYTTLKFPLVQGNKTLLAGYTIDITERVQVEEQLRFLSMHDVLTGIFNRGFFETELARLAVRDAYPVSIVIVDVDNLKKTNDELGHAAGDALLQRAAQALQRTARAGDLIARIGGDEFAIILPVTDAVTAEQQLARLRAELDAQSVQPPAPHLQLSLGVATATTGNLMDTFRLADARMYEDKSAHKQVTEQARYLSTHDALTGIFNRAFFETELARFEPSREFPVSLVVLTVDNLRAVNAEQSHAAGDALLKRAARAMRMAFRASDIIARISGDEFAVILPRTDTTAVEHVVARVKDLVVQFNTDVPDLFLQISLGTATATSGSLRDMFTLARRSARD